MKIYADFGRCVRSFWTSASCRKCVDACPAGALYVDGRWVKAEPSLCVGCGVCMSACPTGVFTAQLGPYISCREGGVCINGLRAEDYVKLVEKYGEITVDARCDDCSLRGRGLEELEKAIKAGLKIRVIRGRGGDIGRRMLLRRGLAKLAGGDNLLEVKRGPPRRISYDREKAVELGLVNPRRPVIDMEKCTACFLCAGVCPTQAIEVDEDEVMLKVDSYKCAECGLCAEACPEGAIKLVEGGEPVETYLFEVEQCPNCGTVYPKKRGVCPVCGVGRELIREVYGV
ncbi:4Fe-4S ferredoxin, iron-sulfur binding domain protein [Pyrobaculum islandicum DSM 4184]|uniref:4Fe-4S ferredoxin, iron-sulfur binding domain protein n=1 Tax=Pyrobaculum islandicum (strain DSM 4184 / JCM 9189 / GEO3) TaxID=384616 RepID=A1RVZ8_PYRIL|nr:4Fe-4S binding protein [Pyrobaculum islandicum]ABL89130.1 4Fe-4S ferredoxin, iron-sulfur binding domain protein [Pyrobaculum islandicum DSM 4184]